MSESESRPKRRRGRNIGSVLKQATKAGYDVNGVTVAADGSVSLKLGRSGAATVSDDNPWDEVLTHHAADQKRAS